ncbi:MAG: c-type cytochrome biogenesis protein CcmI [Methylophagaceae bacterium]
MLWIAIAVMIIIALAIVVLPLLRTAKSQLEDRYQQNIQIAQEQLKKLKDEQRQGLISEEEYKMAQDDLEKILHNDLDNQSTEAVLNNKPAYKTSLALVVSITAIVVALYFSLGSPGMVDKPVASTEPVQMTTAPNTNTDTSGQVSDVRSMFDKLKQRLDNNPDDGQGWKMMGLTYMHFEQFNEAVDAYTKAVALLPDDSDAVKGLNLAKKAQAGASEVTSSTAANIIEKKMVAPNGQTIDVGAMVMRLKAKLDANPDNPQGWMMLGRSYSTLGLHNDAVIAYQNAVKLMPNDPTVQADLKAAQEAVKMVQN